MSLRSVCVRPSVLSCQCSSSPRVAHSPQWSRPRPLSLLGPSTRRCFAHVPCPLVRPATLAPSCCRHCNPPRDLSLSLNLPVIPSPCCPCLVAVAMFGSKQNKGEREGECSGWRVGRGEVSGRGGGTARRRLTLGAVAVGLSVARCRWRRVRGGEGSGAVRHRLTHCAVRRRKRTARCVVAMLAVCSLPASLSLAGSAVPESSSSRNVATCC